MKPAVELGIVLSGGEADLSCVLGVKYEHLNHFERVIKETIDLFINGLVS